MPRTHPESSNRLFTHLHRGHGLRDAWVVILVLAAVGAFVQAIR